jgi:hypothetical protein
MSVSLSEKIGRLTTPPVVEPCLDRDSLGDSTSEERNSFISKRLWQRLQRDLLTRLSLPVQGFVACGTDAVAQSDSDDNLHEYPVDNFTTPRGFSIDNDGTTWLTKDHTAQHEGRSEPPLSTDRGEIFDEILSSAVKGSFHRGPDELFDGQRHEYPVRTRPANYDLAVSDIEHERADCMITVQLDEKLSSQMGQTALDDVAGIQQLPKEDFTSHDYERGHDSNVSGFVSLEDATNEVLAEASEELLALL